MSGDVVVKLRGIGVTRTVLHSLHQEAVGPACDSVQESIETRLAIAAKRPSTKAPSFFAMEMVANPRMSLTA